MPTSRRGAFGFVKSNDYNCYRIDLKYHTLTHNTMEKKQSTTYLAPEAEVFEIKTHGVLCVSGDLPELTYDEGEYKF